MTGIRKRATEHGTATITGGAYITYDSRLDQITVRNRLDAAEIAIVNHRYQVGELALHEVRGWSPYNYRAYQAVSPQTEIDTYLVTVEDEAEADAAELVAPVRHPDRDEGNWPCSDD